MNLGSRVSGCVAVTAAALLGLTMTGIAGTAHAALPREGGSPDVTYQVKTKDPVVFITIDDGIITSQAALDYVRKHKIPITSFLTSSQVTDSKVRYFERISTWGTRSACIGTRGGAVSGLPPESGGRALPLGGFEHSHTEAP